MPSGIQARKLLLSLISISLAAESMRSMGALITASTNPRQPCPIPPQGARALGRKRQTLAQAGTKATELLPARIPGNHAPSRSTGARALGGNKRHDPETALKLHGYYYDKSEAEKWAKPRAILKKVLNAALPGVLAIVSPHLFSAEMNSFLSNLACFMIEIRVPFASSE